MYGSLLVPLDRTSLAEQALPLALGIARRAGARLDLMEVHDLHDQEDPTAGWVPFEPDRDAERTRQEQLYLDATAQWLVSISRVSATASVLPGSAVIPATVADSILERARNRKTDLIVMATHGRGPLSRLLSGSVADEVIRRAGVPVLVVREGERNPGLIPEPVLDNILILLDGSALAEQVLQPALQLARVMEAQCSLLLVVESPYSPADRAPGEPSEKARAEAYLEHVAAKVREQGVPIRTRVIIAQHSVKAVLEEAAVQPSNLIALAAHGRGGLQRLLLGSVADKLVRAAASPVLVYRPAGKEL